MKNTTEILPSKLDWFLRTMDDIWEQIAALHRLSFRELWFFNVKVRYYCLFGMHVFYTVQEIGGGGRSYVEKTVLSCLNKHC